MAKNYMGDYGIIIMWLWFIALILIWLFFRRSESREANRDGKNCEKETGLEFLSYHYDEEKYKYWKKQAEAFANKYMPPKGRFGSKILSSEVREELESTPEGRKRIDIYDKLEDRWYSIGHKWVSYPFMMCSDIDHLNTQVRAQFLIDRGFFCPELESRGFGFEAETLPFKSYKESRPPMRFKKYWEKRQEIACFSTYPKYIAYDSPKRERIIIEYDLDPEDNPPPIP